MWLGREGERIEGEKRGERVKFCDLVFDLFYFL